jgi:hypothetical protein
MLVSVAIARLCTRLWDLNPLAIPWGIFLGEACMRWRFTSVVDRRLPRMLSWHRQDVYRLPQRPLLRAARPL